MEQSLDSLVINPFFYDLLSGEFQPATDKSGRKHTLARLAVATFLKGSSEEEKQLPGDLVPVRYTPLWGGSVSAGVLMERVTEKRNILRGVSLAIGDDYNSLNVSIEPGVDGPRVLLMGNDDQREEGMLEEYHRFDQGPDLDITKMKVSTLANIVFTEAAEQTSR